MIHTTPKETDSKQQRLLPLREGGVFSWRLVAVLSLMGCLVVEVLLNLLPIDYDTPLIYWFFPVSLLLASQMYFNQRFTRHFEIKLLLAFFAWGLVTVVLNYSRAPLTNSYYWFASISTVIFLCFSLPYAFEKADARRVLLLLAVVTFVAVVLYCAASLIAVFAKGVAAKAPSIFEDIFITEGRLRIDDHPNRSAPAPALGVVLAGILLAGAKKGWQRVLVVLGAVVCFVPLALTVSRTAILGAGFAIGFEVFLVLRDALRGRLRAVLRWLICLAAAGVVVVAFYKGAALAAEVSSAALAQQTQTQAQDTAELEEVITRDLSDAESFNGRTDIWLGVWNGLMQNPKILLIGTGPTMTINAMLPYFPPTSASGPFHNSFFDVLVALGIPGILLLLVFFAVTAIAAIRLSLGKASDQPLMVKMLPAVMILVFTEGMMEDEMFFSTLLNVIWIWLMISAGFVLRLGKKEPAQQGTKDS